MKLRLSNKTFYNRHNLELERYLIESNVLHIINLNSIKRYLKKNKPSMVIHLAGLSRPMRIHEKNISKKFFRKCFRKCLRYVYTHHGPKGGGLVIGFGLRQSQNA